MTDDTEHLFVINSMIPTIFHLYFKGVSMFYIQQTKTKLNCFYKMDNPIPFVILGQSVSTSKIQFQLICLKHQADNKKVNTNTTYLICSHNTKAASSCQMSSLLWFRPVELHIQ